MSKVKAIALISGGLDSILAARLVLEQGIRLIAVHFRIPFYSDRSGFHGDKPVFSGLVAQGLGTGLKVFDVKEEFLDILIDPAFGFGSSMNPCIDCKILMLKRARELMMKRGASFVVTGEVLGQRPMSQHRQAMNTVVRQAGLDGLVLRPLCAKLLEETLPERYGWVRREELLSINGRSRKAQLELAGSFGIKDYAQPSGGCLLTEPGFSRKLKDLITHGRLNMADVKLLKVGRHFRISRRAKLVIGRDQRENAALESLARRNDYLFFPPPDTAGPIGLARGVLDTKDIENACRITCRYCDLNGAASLKIRYKRSFKHKSGYLQASALDEEGLGLLRI
jgi:tRNA U34 2-thiouridine synthase MnmA/TrmU